MSMIIATLLPNNADGRMQHPEPMIRLVELVLMLTQGQYGGVEFRSSGSTRTATVTRKMPSGISHD